MIVDRRPQDREEAGLAVPGEPGGPEEVTGVVGWWKRVRSQRRSGTATLLGSLAVFVAGVLAGSNVQVGSEVTSVDRTAAFTATPTDRPSTTTPMPTTSTTITPSTTTTSTTPQPPAPDAEARSSEDAAVHIGPAARTTRPRVAAPGRASTSRPTRAPSPAPGPTCRNSEDPACGPLRFDPPPVNEPMQIDVTFSPRDPEPGKEVTFTIKVKDDGPASPEDCVNTQTYGEPDEKVDPCTPTCPPPLPRHGPWDPPPPGSTDFEEKFSHTYEERGTYTATFSYNVGADCTLSPYRSSEKASVEVVVD